MVVVHAFILFLFFRILSAAMFDDPLTIWASALSAIVVTIIMAVAGPFGIAAAYTEINGKERLRIERLRAVAMVSCAAGIIAAYLIALGFSERLYRDISRWPSYREFWEQDLFWFGAMISIPVVSHLSWFYWKFASTE